MKKIVHERIAPSNQSNFTVCAVVRLHKKRAPTAISSSDAQTDRITSKIATKKEKKTQIQLALICVRCAYETFGGLPAKRWIENRCGANRSECAGTQLMYGDAVVINRANK